MRPWFLCSFASLLLACSGGSEPVAGTIGGLGNGAADISPLYALCVRACAHIHDKNCADAPAVATETCLEECHQVDIQAGSQCTDEQASLYACIETATIKCGGSIGTTYEVSGCEEEQEAKEACADPQGACIRSPASDEACLGLRPPFFYQCSEGAEPSQGPPCIQISFDGFCCPL